MERRAAADDHFELTAEVGEHALAEKFFAVRDKAPEEEPAVRELIVEDLSK